MNYWNRVLESAIENLCDVSCREAVHILNLLVYFQLPDFRVSEAMSIKQERKYSPRKFENKCYGFEQNGGTKMIYFSF